MYHWQKVHAMSPADNLSNKNLVSGFSSAVLRSPGSQALLYADGMSFLQQSIMNILNNHMYAEKTCNSQTRYQPRLSTNVWYGVDHDFLIGPLGTFCTFARTCLQGMFGAHTAIHAGMCANRCSQNNVLHA